MLRKTRSARNRRKPFHRMIGIYLRRWLQPFHTIESAGPHDDLSRRQRSLRENRRPATPAEMAIERLPAIALIHVDHGLAPLIVVGFSHDDVEGEYASALPLAVRTVTYCD